MEIKKKYIFRFFVAILFIIVVLIIGVFLGWYFPRQGSGAIKNGSSINFGRLSALFQSNKSDGNVLSGFVEKVTGENPIPTQILSSPTEIPATPTPIEYKITFIDSPTELMEGGQATFTWTIAGPPRTIHKSVVYFGTMNTPGILTKDVAPVDTKYTDSVKDFIAGDFVIPITFVGNTIIAKPGIYFARAYALIDSNNYWSEERVFTVKPITGYEIRLINYPQKVKLNENSTFTWEITGPQTITSFTAIVGAKESKSGKLDETIDLTKTPYKVLVRDFTNGAYTIPLRYVGNTIMPEYGIYYIRALGIINGKNIWSDEYTLSVQ